MQRAPREDRIFRLPYGDQQLEFMAQPWFDVDVVESGSMPAIDDLPAAVLRAMRDPRKAPSRGQLPREARRLGDIASDAANLSGDKPTAVVVVTDLTRACPDDVLVPPILEELNARGIPDAQITVVIAVGLHRATTDAEKREKLGAVVDRVRVIDSDGRDPATCVDLGPIPPYGVPGSTQRIVKDADV